MLKRYAKHDSFLGSTVVEPQQYHTNFNSTFQNLMDSLFQSVFSCENGVGLKKKLITTITEKAFIHVNGSMYVVTHIGQQMKSVSTVSSKKSKTI